MITDSIDRLGGRLTLLAFNPVAGLAENARQRRAIRQLRKLDDHKLDDIGIVRSEIEEVVRNGRSWRQRDAAKRSLWAAVQKE